MKCEREAFEAFLAENGWSLARTKSSHSSWTKPGCSRPVVVDTNYEDVPDMHLTSNLRTMGLTRKDLRDFLDRGAKK